MLEIKHVTKSYGTKKALDGVTLTLPQGEIVGLFGENGAGKTTLFKSILGFHPYHGEITLDGAPITRHNIARLSFATSEHSFFPHLTPAAHRDFYREHFPSFSDKRFHGRMEFFDLPMHKPLRAFSTGQKNQFEVILALCQGADYILMDEPFVGLDPIASHQLKNVMQEHCAQGGSIFFSTHVLEVAEKLCHKVAIIKGGKLVADGPMAEIRGNASLEQVFLELEDVT